MAEDGTAAEQAADELYGLPLGEFTGARDERAKALRKEGDREAADAVKALRKPTVAAWALNQLARRRREDLDRLLEAGRELRAAQDQLLEGGDRAAFTRAAAAERELVAELAAAATALAADEGQRGAGLREKVAETLHAAALDEETAAELDAGRLLREREAIGGFGAALPATAPPAAASARGRKRRAGRGTEEEAPAPGKSTRGGAAKPPGGAGGAKGRANGAAGRAREEAAAHEEREAAARDERLAATREAERHARREVESAARELRHAAERAETASTRAEAAEAHAREVAERASTAQERAREATERAKEAARRLKEADRAEKAARRALEQARRKLDAAESGG